MCAGSLVFMANKLHRSRVPGFPTMLPDKTNVFANSVEFVRHHREAPTHSWNEVDQSDESKLHREMIRHATKVIGNPIVEYGLDENDTRPKLYKVKSVRNDVITARICGCTLDNQHVCTLPSAHKGHHSDSTKHLHWNATHWWHDTLR